MHNAITVSYQSKRNRHLHSSQYFESGHNDLSRKPTNIELSLLCRRSPCVYLCILTIYSLKRTMTVLE